MNEPHKYRATDKMSTVKAKILQHFESRGFSGSRHSRHDYQSHLYSPLKFSQQLHFQLQLHTKLLPYLLLHLSAERKDIRRCGMIPVNNKAAVLF